MVRWKGCALCRFVAKILIFFMIIQGWPLWELSQWHHWDPKKFCETVSRVLALFAPAEAHAADPVADAAGEDPTPWQRRGVGRRGLF